MVLFACSWFTVVCIFLLCSFSAHSCSFFARSLLIAFPFDCTVGCDVNGTKVLCRGINLNIGRYRVNIFWGAA